MPGLRDGHVKWREAMDLHFRFAAACGVALALQAGAARAQPNEARVVEDAPRAATFATRLSERLNAPGGLRVEDVARRAAARSTSAAVLHEDVLSAAARLDETIVAYFPRLAGSARYRRLSPIAPPASGKSVVADPRLPSGPVPPGSVLFNTAGRPFPVYFNEYYLQASLTVPISDYLLRLRQQQAAAEHRHDAARLLELAGRRQAAIEARLAYYAWLRARAEVLLAEMSLEQAESHLLLTQKLVAEGRLREGERLRLGARREDAAAVVEKAKSFEEVSLAELCQAMNDRCATRYEPAEMLPEEAASEPLATLEGLQREAMRTRPELQAAREQVAAAERDTQVSNAGLWPRLDGAANLLTANPNPRYFPQQDQFHTAWDVGVTLSWSPNDAAQSVYATRDAQATSRKSALQRQPIRNQILMEVLKAYCDLRDAKMAVRVTEQTLAANELAYREARDRYAEGMTTLTDLDEVESELFQARLKTINARTDVRAANARLAYAVGR